MKPGTHFKHVCNYLNKKGVYELQLQLVTVIESAKLFDNFLNFFQRSETSIHALYDHIKKLLFLIASNVCNNVDIECSSLFSDNNIKTIDSITLPESILKLTTDLKNDCDILTFKKLYKDHWVKAGRYLLEKVGKHLDIFESFKILDSIYIASEAYDDEKLIKRLLRKFPYSTTNHNFESAVLIEYKLLKYDIKNSNELDEIVSIDSFWSAILKEKTATNEKKYSNLDFLIKSVLSASHGNSNVERGFSTSSNILTEQRNTLSEKSINAILHVIDIIHFYNSKVHLIPLPKELISMAHSARKNYLNYLEDEKNKKNSRRESNS